MLSHSRTWPKGLLLGFAFLFLLLVLLNSSETAEAIPRHEVSVSLHPEELFANVTLSKLGAVTFDGNLTVDKPQGVERVTVSLTADIDKNWSITISPQTIPFINPGSERFTVTVVVDPDTPPISGTVTVLASARSPVWNDEATCEAIVTVRPFYKFSSTIVHNYDTVRPGDSVVGEVIIENHGTGEDTYFISLEDVPDVVVSWHFQEAITIPGKTDMAVPFTLNIDEDYSVPYDGASFSLTFKVRSDRVTLEDYSSTFSTPFFLHFEGLEEKLVNNWTTYVGYGVAIALRVTVTFLILRRRRRRSEIVGSAEE